MNQSTFIPLSVIPHPSGWRDLTPRSNLEAFVNPTLALESWPPPPLFVEVRRNEASRSVFVFSLKFCQDIPVGQICFPLRSWISDTCLVRLKTLEYSDPSRLAKVSIRSDVPAIEKLQNFLTSTCPVFVSEGSCLKLVGNDISENAELVITSTQPFKTGLICQSTVVEMTKCSYLPKFWPLVKYSIGLISRSHVIQNSLSQQLRSLCRNILVHQVQLINLDHARWLLQESGLARKLCLSTTVFAHTWSEERVELVTINSMKVWRVHTSLVHFKYAPKVLVTSETLSNLGIEENENLLIEPSLDSLVPNVERLSISFLNNSSYTKCSTRELDEILKKVFQQPKLLFQKSVNSIFVQDFLSLETQRFSWVLPPNARLVFKVVTMQCEDRFGLVSQDNTALSQKRTIVQVLPSESLIMTTSTPRNSIPSLPRPLMQLQKEILQRIKGSLLIQGHHSQGLDLLFRSLSSHLGHSLRVEDCANFLGDNSANTEIKLINALAKASELRPFLLILNNIHALAKNREGHLDYRVINRLQREISRQNRDPHTVVIALAPINEPLDPLLHAVFGHVMPVPDLDSTQDISKVLRWLIEYVGIDLTSEVDVKGLAQKCVGFSFTDLQETLERAQKQAQPAKVSHDVLDGCIRQIQDLASDSIGTPRIPQVRWSDIGGLEKAKNEIRDTIDLPLEHPELVENGLKRSGVLLYGPPGTGKTMLAKVVASECNLNFLSVKGPELINPYVGQSEQNIRDIFTQAKKASPSIIFFDELDSLAPNRGNTGDSGGVMDRIVSQLLTQLDDMSNDLVFVIGATNRPDMIDPALLRPGRFDRLIHLGAAQTLEERRSIFQSVTQKIQLESGLRLEDILTLFPEHLTGADITAIVSSASYKAIGRLISDIETQSQDDVGIEPEVLLTFSDFESVAKEFVPSIPE
ncbi:peroxisomal ATPase PEX6-like [Tigriopus californicus]|uniref:peroxisomal ATPase PEX6-like n=1 Tax=Tigriopus californicus TaxID=6832 RepID=UPI0027D9D303|nr:peroxisomal ATPase PEX6-like [Tigriopus californicus]